MQKCFRASVQSLTFTGATLQQTRCRNCSMSNQLKQMQPLQLTRWVLQQSSRPKLSPLLWTLTRFWLVCIGAIEAIAAWRSNNACTPLCALRSNCSAFLRKQFYDAVDTGEERIRQHFKLCSRSIKHFLKLREPETRP